MLAKSQRLTTKQLKEVMEKGRVSHSPLFLIRSLGGQSETKFAAVAPVKIAKKAVTRNRIRRKIYAELRSFIPSLSPSTWVIIFTKKDIGEMLAPEISSALHDAISKANLLKSR